VLTTQAAFLAKDSGLIEKVVKEDVEIRPAPVLQSAGHTGFPDFMG
jgi:hypothetical protein